MRGWFKLSLAIKWASSRRQISEQFTLEPSCSCNSRPTTSGYPPAADMRHNRWPGAFRAITSTEFLAQEKRHHQHRVIVPASTSIAPGAHAAAPTLFCFFPLHLSHTPRNCITSGTLERPPASAGSIQCVLMVFLRLRLACSLRRRTRRAAID